MLKYKVYSLIHPDTKKICYVGFTSQPLNKRLSQHMKPKKNNHSFIAKVTRKLLRENKKFSIKLILDFDNEAEALKSEIFYIEYFKKQYKLYNTAPGGKVFKPNKKTIKKMLNTRKANNLWKPLKGEKNGQSVLSEKEVLYIYSLIKSNMSNNEIIKKINISMTTLCAIRTGQNWSWLFVQHFDKYIPSPRVFKNSYSVEQKLDILKMIINNYSIKNIQIKYPKMQTTDIKRIRNKKLWKGIWEIYQNRAFIK
jgi:hypothetical protein